MRKYIPKDAKLLPAEAKKVFTGVITDIYQWPQEMFDGSIGTFEMTKRPDTVKIVAVLMPEELEAAGFTAGEDPKIVVTQQEQPRKDIFYDIPGGRVDAEDSDELEAAKRELHEETGLIMRDWKLIKVTQPFSKIDWLVYTFMATGFVGREQQSLDAGEKIKVLAMNIDEVKALENAPEARYLEIDEAKIEDLLNRPGLFDYSR